MRRITLDLWVGLFVVAGLGALVILAMKVGNLGSFGSPEVYTVYAEFDNIGGLKSRAPVKSAGVVVGRVNGIEFDTQSYKARVGMQIEKRYPFSRDTSAAILTSGLLGEQYVGLETGADSAMLNDTDKVTLTQSAVVLEKLIGQFIYSRAAEGSGNGAGAGKSEGGDKPEAASNPEAGRKAEPGSIPGAGKADAAPRDAGAK
jgi:phospholipid/cholesterol/gamma-HCH transport system substrate-binding protein